MEIHFCKSENFNYLLKTKEILLVKMFVLINDTLICTFNLIRHVSNIVQFRVLG